MTHAPETVRKALDDAARNPADLALVAKAVGTCAESGRPLDAVPLLERAIAAQPQSADLRHWLGLMLRQAGRLTEATVQFEHAVRLRPGHAEAHNALGVTRAELGDAPGAAASFEASLRIWPHLAETHRNLGLALRRSGNAAKAVQSFDEAIRLKPDQAASHHQRALALSELKRREEALASVDRCIALAPNVAEAHDLRGMILSDLGRSQEALDCFDAAIALGRTASLLNNRGIALHRLARLPEALASFNEALALQPDSADGWNNHGVTLRMMGRIEDSVASFTAAVKHKPDFAQAHLNLGYSFRELGRVDEAVACYDRALAAQPDYVEASWNKAIALLLGGRLQEGFELFECRWNKESFTSPRRGFRAPLWSGQEALAGKTILLHSEQGLGDAIQFARYVPLVAQQGGRVVLEVPRALTGLLGSLSGIAQIVERGKPLPAFDFHCPLMSLPRAFRTTLDTIPSPAGYLAADEAKLAHWGARLGPATSQRIGLVWSGSPAHKSDLQRSLGLARLMEALPAGPQYVSLQREIRDTDEATLRAYPALTHFGAELEDFRDTAALCAAMDLVISVDTSVAHLAGAMGRPTWLLLAHSPDWRWLLERPDTPWYASMRLFRQDASREWSSALSPVADALRSRP